MAKLFVKVTPLPTSSLATLGMIGVEPSGACAAPIVSNRWSSVRMSTMFGRDAFAVLAGRGRTDSAPARRAPSTTASRNPSDRP